MQILIVCPRAFAWGWGGDTPRLLEMSRGLHRSGWDVRMLCCKYAGDKRFAAVAQAFPGRIVGAPFYGPFSSVFNQRLLRRALRSWWRLRGYQERDDYPEIVAPRLLKFGIKAGVQKPDVVFGYSGGHLESFVAAHQFGRHFGVPLVLEFRDPIPPPNSPPLNPAQLKMLEDALRDASMIMTTTNGISDRVADQFPFTKSRLRTIYSCYDEEFPAASSQASDGLLLVHAGRLFGGNKRNARSLVRAIAEAAKMDPASRNRIRLRLIGAGPGGNEAKTLAEELGIAAAVDLVPQVSHSECKEELNRADVLVVIKYNDPNYDQQIPGKLFQCLGFGKPILGIMRETEGAEILRKSGLGLVFDHSDIAGTAAALLELLRKLSMGEQRCKPDWNYIRQFSVQEMTRKFTAEFAKAASNPNLGSARCPETTQVAKSVPRTNPCANGAGG